MTVIVPAALAKVFSPRFRRVSFLFSGAAQDRGVGSSRLHSSLSPFGRFALVQTQGPPRAKTAQCRPTHSTNNIDTAAHTNTTDTIAMRDFDDSQGRRWQAALLEGSYGHVVLLFSPIEGGEVRQKLIDANYLVEAGTWLATLDEDALRALLIEATPWDPATSGSG